ncbi:SPRY domain-containing protein [Bacillus chungangensis]|uniref:B30.2/SPRY domain-containing protein n=1 Tax=Bacillus chungangensis TaxID=587633 RepID=A0ABT9WTW2_9BACI|nr:SPRY domain-containing protein [Bacillus chungangensis]MDQ0176741.1 hypothetical protein [Bacillus chungangensis]
MKEVTWNPNDVQGSPVLSNENLTVKIRGGVPKESIRATEGKDKGKWYWEVKFDSTSDTPDRFPAYIGILDGSLHPPFVTTHESFRAYYPFVGGRKYPGSAAYGEDCEVGDIVSTLLNLDEGNLEFWKNGKRMGISHTDLHEIKGEKFPVLATGFGSNTDFITVTANFGTAPFRYKMPDGYKPYNHSQDMKIKIITMKL